MNIDQVLEIENNLEFFKNFFPFIKITADEDINTRNTIERTIILVRVSKDAANGGGMRSLLESNYPYKIKHRDFIEAYRAIGADVAADEIKTALDLLGTDEIIDDPMKRDFKIESLVEANEDIFESLDSICGNKEIEKLWRNYIRANKEFFRLRNS